MLDGVVMTTKIEHLSEVNKETVKESFREK